MRYNNNGVVVAELTTCQRMQTRAQARSKVVSDLWVPDCDGYGRFKARQQNWGFSWCVDPLGHRLENPEVRRPSQADCCRYQRHRGYLESALI